MSKFDAFYTCDCDHVKIEPNKVYVKNTHPKHVYKAEVDSEGLCSKCGYHAFWFVDKSKKVIPERELTHDQISHRVCEYYPKYRMVDDYDPDCLFDWEDSNKLLYLKKES